METIKFIEDGTDFVAILSPRNPEREQQIRAAFSGISIEGRFSAPNVTPDTSRETTDAVRNMEKKNDPQLMAKIAGNVEDNNIFIFSYMKSPAYKNTPFQGKVYFHQFVLNSSTDFYGMLNKCWNRPEKEIKQAILQEIMSRRKADKYGTDCGLICNVSFFGSIMEKLRSQMGIEKCTEEIMKGINPLQRDGISKAVTTALNKWYAEWNAK